MPEPPRLLAAGATRPSAWTIRKSASTVGSASGNDLVISDNTVSRRHALITRRDGLIRLSDTNSSNGTFVNGRRVAAAITLKNGDEIRFGNARYFVAGIIVDTVASTQPSSRLNINGYQRLLILAGGLLALVAVGYVAVRFASLNHATIAAPAVPAPASNAASGANAKNGSVGSVANPSEHALP
ncbi:MAG: FHA domain-containing protein, partial [Candidatus Binataceae bacterium]